MFPAIEEPGIGRLVGRGDENEIVNAEKGRQALEGERTGRINGNLYEHILYELIVFTYKYSKEKPMQRHRAYKI